MRRTCIFLASTVLIAACSGNSVTTGSAPVILSTTSTEASGAPPTTDPPPTTTTAPVSSTTTVVVLDRGSAGERMQDDLAALVGLGVREAGSEAEQLAAVFIEETLRGLGAAVEVGEVPLPDRKSSFNVLATFGEGNVHVLLGAHFDSKPPSPGADDNGSGVVVLLEMARRLADVSPEGQRITLAFFGAEEFLIGVDGNAHHFGSRLLADRLASTGDLPDLMVSVDMVGVGEDLLAVTFLESDTVAAGLIAEAAARHGVTVTVESRGDISDHEAFARQGVPSVFLWRPENPDYHLAGDLEVRTAALLEDLGILETFLELAGR